MHALVLIVDGDSERIERARRLVEQEGAVAVTATDSREAMCLYVRREPHVIVLHVDPAHEADLGLCRDMKALRKGRGRSVVVVGPRKSRQAAFEAGCDAFVTQQTDTLSLRRTVRRLLAVVRKPSPDLGVELIA